MPGGSKSREKNISHIGNKTPLDRLVEYGKEQVYVTGGLLFCRLCEISLDHRRKYSIDMHLAGKKHQAKANKSSGSKLSECQTASSPGTSTLGLPKRQITVDVAFQGNASKKAKTDLIHDVITMFASADIALEKLDNHYVRKFLETYVQNASAIPSADYIRRNKVQVVYEAQMEEIKCILLASHSISVVVDETTDARNRAILNILAIPVVKDKPKLIPYLIDTVEFEEVNGTTVAGAVVRCLALFGISYNNVAAFVTDNVNYMKTAFTTVNAIAPSCVHIGCWAHIFSLIGDLWRSEFPDVDEFVSLMKKLFRNSRKKKFLYVEIAEKEGIEKPKTPPHPVLTRWNSWLEAVQQHSEYCHIYPALFEKLKESTAETQAFETLNAVITDDERFKELQQKLRFIAVLSTKICQAVVTMESQSVCAHKVYDFAHDLLSWLRALENKDFYNETLNEGFTPKKARELADDFHGVVTKCRQKLAKYLSEDKESTRYFKAVRIFDTSKVKTMSKRIEVYSAIPALRKPSDDLKTEWNTYMDIAISVDHTVELVHFWEGMQKRTPLVAAIALTCLSVPATSTDAERSFSVMDNIFSDKRQNLSSESLKYLTGMYFNASALKKVD